MNVDELEGRELDAAVEQALGIEWDESRCRVCGWPIVEPPEPGCYADSCSMRAETKRRADEPADYSSSDSAMLWLLRRMGKQSPVVRRLFVDTLRRMVLAQSKTPLGEDDIIMAMTPRQVARAALFALTAGEGE